MILIQRQNQLEIACPAKVNFHLELKGKRPDGFHEIETVMSAISIFDRLVFRQRQDDQLRLTVRLPRSGSRRLEPDEIPTDQRNLVIKALAQVRRAALAAGCHPQQVAAGVDVELDKRIPSAAGLGGASSNAAAAIVAANLIWNLNMPLSELGEIASELGSDIPFFLTSGLAVCRGRGELVESLAAPVGLAVVVAKPSVALSTAEVFSRVQPQNDRRIADTIIDNLQAGRTIEVGKLLFNRLQRFAEPLTNQIDRLRFEFARLDCLGHQMSGSGSSYFGLFRSGRAAGIARQLLASRLPEARVFSGHTLAPPRWQAAGRLPGNGELPWK